MRKVRKALSVLKGQLALPVPRVCKVVKAPRVYQDILARKVFRARKAFKVL